VVDRQFRRCVPTGPWCCWLTALCSIFSKKPAALLLDDFVIKNVERTYFVEFSALPLMLACQEEAIEANRSIARDAT